MRFEFATATRIIFGRGCIGELPDLCRHLGGPVLLVTGRDPARWHQIAQCLRDGGIFTAVFSVCGEPAIRDVEDGVRMAQETGAEVVVGIGGGSAIDAGKAIAAMANQPGHLLDYLEVIGGGKGLDQPPLPYIAVPTTAGTGAEVTRNAVLASPEHRVKASLRHASMLPRVALVDPELALHLPAAITAASGMDALTQCLEAFVSCRSQPMTDALCAAGIGRAARSLERVCTDGQDLAAREDMALAAMWSGMALANAGLGAVHGFAAPIGGMFDAPHGAVCAALLAPSWAANLRAVSERGGDNARRKFQEAAALLTCNPSACAGDAVGWLKGLAQRLRIPGLASFGLTKDDFDEVARKAANASSMKGNPVPLNHAELLGILHEAL